MSWIVISYISGAAFFVGIFLGRRQVRIVAPKMPHEDALDLINTINESVDDRKCICCGTELNAKSQS